MFFRDNIDRFLRVVVRVVSLAIKVIEMGQLYLSEKRIHNALEILCKVLKLTNRIQRKLAVKKVVLGFL